MSLSEKLTNAVNDCVWACKNALEDSFKNAAASLKPGESAPKNNIFHTDEEKRLYIRQGEELRTRALGLIAGDVFQSRQIIAAAPNTEAVNYIAMLANRKNIEPIEFKSAMEKYGSNYTAAKRIIEIAEEHNCQISIKNPAITKAAAQSDLYASLEKALDPKMMLHNISSTPNYYDWYLLQARPKFNIFD